MSNDFEAPRVVRAGEAFWEPGGDVIHYQDGNNRDDVKVRFVVTMLCVEGQPMLVLVDEEELAAKQDLRLPGSHESVAAARDSWRTSATSAHLAARSSRRCRKGAHRFHRRRPEIRGSHVPV